MPHTLSIYKPLILTPHNTTPHNLCHLLYTLFIFFLNHRSNHLTFLQNKTILHSTKVMRSPCKVIQMILIIMRHFHIVLLLVASLSLFHGTNAQLAPQEAASRDLQDASNQSLAIMLVVIVVAFFATGFCSFYIRHCSENYVVSGTTTAIGPKGLDPEVLATFPIMLYSTVKTGQNAALQCAVCLSEFTDFDKLRLLPKCNHVFHPDCIDAWLASHVTCPVCRAKLKPNCGEIAVQIERDNDAHQVFDENAVRNGDAVCGGNEGGMCGNVDGCVGKDNGSSKIRAFGVLVRSHSTGHSLVEPGKSIERFTLTLSEEMRKQILDDNRRGGSMMMKRSASYDVLQGEEGCSGKGWWSRSEGGEGSSKGKNKGWVLSMTPPFVSRGGGSSGVAPNASTTCSGIPRFWPSSIVREDKGSEGKTVFQLV